MYTQTNLFSKIFVFECESIQIKMWRVEDGKEEDGEKKHNHVRCSQVLIYIKPTYFFNIYVCICILWIQLAALIVLLLQNFTLEKISPKLLF